MRARAFVVAIGPQASDSAICAKLAKERNESLRVAAANDARRRGPSSAERRRVPPPPARYAAVKAEVAARFSSPWARIVSC